MISIYNIRSVYKASSHIRVDIKLNYKQLYSSRCLISILVNCKVTIYMVLWVICLYESY